MTKEELRQKFKSSRLDMDKAEVAKKSRLITNRAIKSINWGEVSSVHCYEPIYQLNEVDSLPLIKYLKTNWPQITLATQSKSQKLPAEKPRPYDLVIVPTLAFDNRGYRLGWGGGFYDRFLASQPAAQKIGLCFENGRLDQLPNEPHDIALDRVITEI